MEEDFQAPDPNYYDPMVISIELAEFRVSKVSVDQGSSINILYWKAFWKIVGFLEKWVNTQGYLDLSIKRA